MNNWRKFLDSISSNGGALLMLFILHNILLVCLIIGSPVLFKDSYFLVLGALIGLLKGESSRSQHPMDIPQTKQNDDTNTKVQLNG